MRNVTISTAVITAHVLLDMVCLCVPAQMDLPGPIVHVRICT